MQQRRKNKGFTILPILIGVAILAVFATMGLDSAAKYVDEARISKAIAEIGTIEVAISKYNTEHKESERIKAGTTNWKTLLRDNGYLDIMPEYEGKYGCSYSLYETSYATSSTKKATHVQLTSCSFAKDYKSPDGTQGVIRMYSAGSGS